MQDQELGSGDAVVATVSEGKESQSERKEGQDSFCSFDRSVWEERDVAGEVCWYGCRTDD
jgi:hypothetical protein